MTTEIQEGYKRCSTCGEVKPVEEYYKDRYGKDGLRGYCKTCASERRKKYYNKNKDKIREHMKEYREENKDKIREHMKEYRKENKDKIREHMKEYREENKDRIREYKREYREENKDRIREYMKEYREENKDRKREYDKKYFKCVKKPSCPLVGGLGAKFVILTCPICGKEFRLSKAKVDYRYERVGQTHFYCSRECYHESIRKSHKSEYEKNINRIRKEQRL